MKSVLKKLIKYIGIFFVTIFVLFSLLVISSKIPKSSIEKNMQESAEFYKNKRGIENIDHLYNILHYYADSMILNIIYNIDSDNPIESTLWANYYQTRYADINDDFVRSVKFHREGNTQYVRYWHGSMMIIRPLMTFLNIEGIYILNNILLYILCIILFIMLVKKSKNLAIAYLLAMIMIVFPTVGNCLEYSYTFYIMFIASIIAISIEKKGDKNLYALFFITGIVTCFFDFLSTEIITLFIPLIIVLAIRKKEGRLGSFKETFIFVLKSILLWGTAYCLTWLAKWTVASIVLNINAIDYVKDQALIRINGQVNSVKYNIYTDGLYRNIHAIIPLVFIQSNEFMYICIAIFFALVLILFDWKNIKKKWYSLILLFIALAPYVRYLILANHSFRHFFFTYRAQSITIIAIILIIIDCLNYKLFKKSLCNKEKNNYGNINNNDITSNLNNKNFEKNKKELTILIPCLNEEKTLGICINKAKKFLSENNINGEILIADNGSIDNSKKIAKSLGVRVIEVQEKGYGNALINGTKSAKGKYTIMGDADDSYNFLEIMPILEKLREGNDFVIGNRYKGKMEKGAMPFSNKYIGTPIISWIGRKKCKIKIGDFNCGLRGYDTQKIIDLNCKCPGMEYATEMIIKAKQSNLKIVEVPINFYKDGRNQKPHLKAISDGFRHLKVLF